MSVSKLTREEAEILINMVKRSLIAEIYFPNLGETKEFNVVGDTKSEVFTIKIFRGKLNLLKYNIGARIKKNGIMLLELHVNLSSVHCNPDGKKIIGSHWHIFTEEYGRAYAFPAENIESDQFEKNTLAFLIRFNVVETPEIHYQNEYNLPS